MNGRGEPRWARTVPSVVRSPGTESMSWQKVLRDQDGPYLTTVEIFPSPSSLQRPGELMLVALKESEDAMSFNGMMNLASVPNARHTCPHPCSCPCGHHHRLSRTFCPGSPEGSLEFYYSETAATTNPLNLPEAGIHFPSFQVEAMVFGEERSPWNRPMRRFLPSSPSLLLSTAHSGSGWEDTRGPEKRRQR